MDNTVAYIQSKGITNEYEIIKLLMEKAEKLSSVGQQKQALVVQSYMKLASDQPKNSTASGEPLKVAIPVIPVDTIVSIINAIVYISKTAISINDQTGIVTKMKSCFTSIFKKSTTTTTTTTAAATT